MKRAGISMIFDGDKDKAEAYLAVVMAGKRHDRQVKKLRKAKRRLRRLTNAYRVHLGQPPIKDEPKRPPDGSILVLNGETQTARWCQPHEKYNCEYPLAWAYGRGGTITFDGAVMPPFRPFWEEEK